MLGVMAAVAIGYVCADTSDSGSRDEVTADHCGSITVDPVGRTRRVS